VNVDGTGYAVLRTCVKSDVSAPQSSLTVVGNKVYGLAQSGGDGGSGGIFMVNLDGTGYRVIYSFSRAVYGAAGSLALVGDTLYGAARNGGSAGYGAIFQFNTNGYGFSVVRNLGPNDGAYPSGGLVAVGNTLYGTSAYGGLYGNGTIFQINPDGTGYTLLKSFAAGGNEGSAPNTTLLFSGGVFYGTTPYGGLSGGGTVFQINPDGSGFQVLKHFAFAEGNSPSSLVVSGNTLYGTTSSGGASDLGTVFRMDASGQNFGLLWDFSSGGGANPGGGLALVGGTLYGTTSLGGSAGNGTIFEVNTDGSSFLVVRHFAGANGDGANPQGGLTISGNSLYGTTSAGGNLGEVLVFSLPIFSLASKPFFLGLAAAQALGFPPGANPFVVSLDGPAGFAAVLSASTNLANWVPIATNQLTGGLSVFMDTDASGYPGRLYRVDVQ